MDIRTKTDIQKLAKQKPQAVEIAKAPASVPIKSVSSIGSKVATQSTGGGIASPLTEPDATTRTYHTSRTITTTDGVFTFVLQDLATIDMTDANGAAVVMEFDAP